MKRTATHLPDFYENLSQLLWGLVAMRTRDLRCLRLDLDHYFLLEAVATGRAHSEAQMVRLLGRDASFCSRAVDRLVKRGWVVKKPSLRVSDSRFQLKLNRKGSGVYQDIQFRFSERVKQKLVAAPSRPKDLRPLGRQVAVLNQVLSDARQDTAPAKSDDGMVQQLLRGL